MGSFVRLCNPKIREHWFIATDFCIGDPNRPNDSFCYTIYPAVPETFERLSGVERDLKDVKVVSDKVIRAFRDGFCFTLCIAADRDRGLFDSLRAVQVAVDETLRVMQAWENAGH